MTELGLSRGELSKRLRYKNFCKRHPSDMPTFAASDGQLIG
jgi:hypothetical protein